MSQKISVLVLGGVGFVGKNLVTHLVDLGCCSYIRVVDKVLPATAYLTEAQQKAFQSVEFVQGNLVNPTSIEKCFSFKETPVAKWDVVFNLAAETKYSQTDQIYQEKVFVLTTSCARHAATASNVGIFIEVSTAQVYDPDKRASKEDSKTKPWTAIAKYKLQAEEELKNITGLRYIVVRPALIYGIGDTNGLTPRLLIAAVYKELKEEMKFLWSKDLRLNTVHVSDVYQEHLPNGAIFNLADKGDTDQEKINVILSSIFGIKTGYQGTIISNLARFNLADVTEEINDKHLQPWSDICKRFSISNSPLTPYLDQELLYNNSLTVDGSKIEKLLGFKYEVSELSEVKIREVISAFSDVGIFPKNYV